MSLIEWLETKSTDRIRSALSAIVDLKPITAQLLIGTENTTLCAESSGCNTREVRVEEVQVGDIVVIRAGEKVPVDGVVVSGSSSVDESSLTGESLVDLYLMLAPRVFLVCF